jgi:hypothetical protein
MIFILLMSGISSIQSAETVYTSVVPQKLSDIPEIYQAMYKAFYPNIKVLEELPKNEELLKIISAYDYFIVPEDDTVCAQLMRQYCNKAYYYGKYSVKQIFFRNKCNLALIFYFTQSWEMHIVFLVDILNV